MSTWTKTELAHVRTAAKAVRHWNTEIVEAAALIRPMLIGHSLAAIARHIADELKPGRKDARNARNSAAERNARRSTPMLVLTRTRDQAIILTGPDGRTVAKITLVDIRDRSKARIGIDAPGLAIAREELLVGCQDPRSLEPCTRAMSAPASTPSSSPPPSTARPPASPTGTPTPAAT